jgi:hypothetical protein
LYDASSRRLLVGPHPPRNVVLNEVVRALIDQNYGLRRLAKLRARDRDGWLAARGIVDGTAALASRVQTNVCGNVAPGRALAAELRYLGGNSALASALRTFPQTTEQLLHIDKFLERERALPVRLPQQIGVARLTTSETFGELDVRNLLRAFRVPTADAAAAGWGGGRLALYGGVAVLVLRWDSADDAAEWQAAVPQYVAAAFPGATAHTCPPLDHCWSGPGEIAAGVFGTTSVLASGPGAATVAAPFLTLK